MLFEEITASSLIAIDQDGNKLCESAFPVNRAGFVIHSAIHAGREDAQCVLHTHTRAGVAVSAQKEGVLPISQQSTFVLASLAYHDYEGVAVRDDERPRLQHDLGDRTFMMLRNHGLLVVGPSIADAFLAMYIFRVDLSDSNRRAGGRRGIARGLTAYLRGCRDRGANPDAGAGRRVRVASLDAQA